VGGNLATPANLPAKYNETTQFAMSNKCRRNYRQRLARIIRFWKAEDPEYYAVGVQKVAADDLNDATKYFFSGHFTEDLIYAGLNEQFVLHFLVSTKEKENGKLKSVEDIRKYKDAIMWGATEACERLPTSFYEMVDNFLSGYKKEWTSAKKKGNVEEVSADPIPMPLYKLLLKWALDSNNIMVWHWTQAQWSFMGRSASIDPLHTRNFKLGVDSIVGKYDDSKADKTAQRLSEKNIYANPFDYTMCFWTGFGIWIALRGEEKMKGGNNRLFLNPGVKEGSAATKYCEQMVGVVAPHIDKLMNHMSHDRFNPYGLRKGAATYAVAGTTVPPPIPSVANRGEWSIGMVLDVYWHFGSVGD
jgi:hypothetical protein